MSTIQHLVPAQGLRALVAHLDHGAIRFARIEGDQVVVECSEGVSIERSGDQLRIRGGGRRMADTVSARIFSQEADTGEPRQSGGPEKGDLGSFISTMVNQAVGGLLRGDLFGSAHGRVRVGVPALLEMPRIEAHSAAGDLSLEGLRGEIVLHSHMGDITVADGGGSLEARSGKGDIDVRDFRGPMRVHTGAGEVELNRCSGGGMVNTGAGDIDGRDLRGGWELRTGSGDVHVAVDETAALRVSTGSGDVDIAGGSVESLEIRTGSGDLSCASVLRGASHQFTTGAGDITLALANPPGARIQALTRMGSISSEFPLVMVGKQGPHSSAGSRYVGSIGDSAIDVELRTSYGDIEITRLEPGRATRTARREAAPIEPPFVPVPPVPPVAPMPPVPPIPPIPPAYGEAGLASPSGEYQEKERSMPEEPTTPAYEKGSEGAWSEAAEPVPAGGPAEPAAENPRLKILESLQRGEITAPEAAALLRALSGA